MQNQIWDVGEGGGGIAKETQKIIKSLIDGVLRDE